MELRNDGRPGDGTPDGRGTMLRGATPAPRAALDALFPTLYAELRRLARRQLRRERRGHTLDSTALVHEAYLRLSGAGGLRPENRAHFFAIAARAMRAILVDHARARATAKRGGGAGVVSLDALDELEGPGASRCLVADHRAEQLLALDEALSRLAAVDVDACRTVECRYFVGLTLEEIATALDLSVGTVRRRWDFAKAWLHRELSRPE